ncbi:MAG TPA: LacI family DNA-binding transcriptional regulator [Candidatus Hydrogenedens sp.]|nr:LacI family DNA-binding transcriptional regulator [Candidatus Hydrogenedens sp.]HOL21193.1 LacI family DNA-binding transcriptional regulator [Candidatus Hydrogenedens sp.]HPP59554.1 LacI family DNA-binding transcriptional regulator [Candidatus Hydrogenedens sp.]
MFEKITIYDIAKMAGVSAKTVSKVINFKDGVKDETRKKVLEIVEKLGYHPNIFARSLRANQPACIGVTFPAPIEIVPFSPNFFLWLFMELYRVFGKKGEYICFDMFPYELGKIENYARGVFDNLFKACIIAGPLSLSDVIARKIHVTGIPYVAFGRLESFPELSYATVDYEKAAYISTKFLIDRGHKYIAILQGFHNYQPGVERVRGYKRALEESGLPFSERHVKYVNFGASNVALRVHQLLSDTNITALIDSSGTENGEAVREGIKKSGRKIGRDCEVLTWTYEEKGIVLDEASAHVWLPVRESASEGIELLSKWVEGKSEGPIKVLFNPILDTERKSQKIIEPTHRFFETLPE